MSVLLQLAARLHDRSVAGERSVARFARFALALTLAIGMISGSVGQTPAEHRFALVIANEDYPGAIGRLTNPHVDAQAMEIALKKAGFSVVVLRDLDKTQILTAVTGFADRLHEAGPGAIGFFYYSGHGASAEVANERHNYLIPSRTQVADSDQLAVRGVRLNQLIEDLEASKAKAIFVVFDACRNTIPLPSGDKSLAEGKGFVAVDRSSGLYIAFATPDGYTTPDDAIYSRELAQKLTMPGLTADRAFTLANRAVAAQRNFKRPPFVADGLRDDVCFVTCPVEVTQQQQQALSPGEEFLVFKTALDQATESAFVAYLSRYPGGQYSAVAERELATIRAARPAACPRSELVVYFYWDRSDLSPEAADTIETAIGRSRLCRLQSVVITGHTDTTGSSQYNLQLSQRMARAVTDLMIAQGIPASTITATGVGESDLARPTGDDVREPLNRRVEVTMSFS